MKIEFFRRLYRGRRLPALIEKEQPSTPGLEVSSATAQYPDRHL
jgi:hypothetical protein